MRTLILAFFLATAGASPAIAQTPFHRFYVGATGAIDDGSRSNILGAVPSAAVLVGFRVSRSWGVEVELEQAFHDTATSTEAGWISLAGPNATREEIERLAIRARWDRSQKAGPGASAHAMWRTDKSGRLNGGIFGGFSVRQYESRVVRTVVSVPPGSNLPPDDWRLQPEDSSRTMTGGGAVIGALGLMQLTPRLAFAPEFRLTGGGITDDPYLVFRMGCRLLLSF